MKYNLYILRVRVSTGILVEHHLFLPFVKGKRSYAELFDAAKQATSRQNCVRPERSGHHQTKEHAQHTVIEAAQPFCPPNDLPGDLQ